MLRRRALDPLHMLRKLAALTLLLLAFPAAAQAKARDRNHDGIPDKWAKRHHVSSKGKAAAKQDPDKDGLDNRAEFLSGTNPHKADSNGNGVPDANEDPDRDGVDNGNEIREHTNPRAKDTNRNGVKDGQEDADHDRLNNTGEDQAGTDPINPDSDGDGVEDGQEGAGKVAAFDGSTLTIQLFTGASLTGAVDDTTDVSCGDEGDGSSDDSPDFRIAADDSADGSDTSDSGDSTDGSDSTDSGDDGDSTDLTDSGPSCSLDDLSVGTVVQSASLDVGSDGAFFSEIDLAP